MRTANPPTFGQTPLRGQALTRLKTTRIELLLDIFQDGFHLFDIG